MLIGSTKLLFAQEQEFGVWVGGVNYFGDLNPTYSFKDTRLAVGGIYRYNLNDRMAVRMGLAYAFIEGHDSKIKNHDFLKARNLSFQSQIFELSAVYEINFFKYSTLKGKRKFSPYIFAGGSVFYAHPITKFNGEKYGLESVGTEGQKSPNRIGKNRGYSDYSFAIPFGLGIKYAINQNWSINAEVSSRKTFTDFIDDVSGLYPEKENVNYFDSNGNNIGLNLYDRSVEIQPNAIGVAGKQRGTSRDKDRFNFFGVTLTYTIITAKCPKVL